MYVKSGHEGMRVFRMVISMSLKIQIISLSLSMIELALNVSEANPDMLACTIDPLFSTTPSTPNRPI